MKIKKNKKWIIILLAVVIIAVLAIVIFMIPGKNDSLNPGGQTTVKVYFGNKNLDPEMSCDKVFPVERTVPNLKGVTAMSELLKGTLPDEMDNGYFTSIGPGVQVQSLTIKDGTAYIDFNKVLDEGVAGSCRVLAIRSQITETLKQFPNVEDVVISIDGRTEDILQP